MIVICYVSALIVPSAFHHVIIFQSQPVINSYSLEAHSLSSVVALLQTPICLGLVFTILCHYSAWINVTDSTIVVDGKGVSFSLWNPGWWELSIRLQNAFRNIWLCSWNRVILWGKKQPSLKLTFYIIIKLLFNKSSIFFYQPLEHIFYTTARRK